MKTKSKRGRPRKPPGESKSFLFQIRVRTIERDTFHAAAQLAGLETSSWARERLMALARKELLAANRAVPFLQ